MRKIAIFMHLALMGNGPKIHREQILRMKNAGLLETVDEIHVGISGEGDPYPEPVCHPVKIVAHEPHLRAYEFPTLMALHEFATANQDYAILYVHTKGASWVNKHGGTAMGRLIWKDEMERVLIDDWRVCLPELETHDTVGAFFRRSARRRSGTWNAHYAGNFWWANAEFVAKRPEVRIEVDRFWAERWLMDGGGRFHNRPTAEANPNVYVRRDRRRGLTPTPTDTTMVLDADRKRVVGKNLEQTGPTPMKTTNLDAQYKKEDPWGFKSTPDDAHRKRRILDACGGRYGTALDIGAGEGWITTDLPADSIYGIEGSAIAASRFPGNVTHIQEPVGKYDLVVATGIFYEQYDYKLFTRWVLEHTGIRAVISNIGDLEILSDELLEKVVHSEWFPYRKWKQHLLVLDFT